MALPPEIVEKILINCDGRTLLAARRVCRQWRTLVEYLSKVSIVCFRNNAATFLCSKQKTALWEWCCLEEIPKKELTQYLIHYNRDDPSIWFFIYKNWMTWQNIAEVEFEIVLSPAEIPRITCIDVFGIFSVKKQTITAWCHCRGVHCCGVGGRQGADLRRVLETSDNDAPPGRKSRKSDVFLQWYYDYCSNHFIQIFFVDSILKIVTAYPKALIVDDLYGDGYNHLIIEDVMSHR